MDLLRRSFLSFFVRVLCTFLLVFQPFTVLAFSYDINERLIILEETHLDKGVVKTFSDYLSRDEFKESGKKWTFINKGDLFISAEDLSTLSKLAPVRNAGDIYCVLKEKIDSLEERDLLEFGEIDNLGTLTFSSQKPEVSKLQFKRLENTGDISFVTNNLAQETPSTWHLEFTNLLKNQGVLKSNDVMVLVNKENEGVLDPEENSGIIGGYISAFSLLLEGFNHIKAILKTFGKESFESAGEIVVSPSSNRGDFKWEGIIESTGLTFLKIAPDFVRTILIAAQFQVRGFYAASPVGINFEHSDPLSIQNIMEFYDEIVEDLNITPFTQSLFGEKGIHIGLKEGDLRFSGNYVSKGPVKVSGGDSKVTFEKQFLFEGGLESEIPIAGEITVGEKTSLNISQLIVALMGDPKKFDLTITNYGNIFIKTLQQLGRLRLKNSGNVEISENGGGYPYPLSLLNNTGHIDSPLSVTSSYTRKFFDDREEKPLGGSIQSNGDINIKLSSTYKGTWSQSLSSKTSTIILDAPESNILFDAMHWLSSNGIHLKVKEIIAGAESLFQSSGEIKFEGDKVLFCGKLESPSFIIKSNEELGGRGILNAGTVLLEGPTIILDNFQWGEKFYNLVLRTMGTILLNFGNTASSPFNVKGYLDILANKVQLTHPVRSKGHIKIVTEQKSGDPSRLEIFSRLSSEQGNVFLESPVIKFSEEARIRGKNISVSHQTSPIFEIPSKMISKADGKEKSISILKADNTISFKVDGELRIHGRLSGRAFYVKAGSVFINDRTNSFSGFEKRIFIDAGTVRSSVPIKVDRFITETLALLTHSIITEDFDITAAFASFGRAMLSSAEPSRLLSDDLTLRGTTVVGPSVFGGVTAAACHTFEDVDASRASIRQTAAKFKVLGETRIGEVYLGGKRVLIEGDLDTRRIETGKDLESLEIPGTLTTDQEVLQLRAKRMEMNLSGLKRREGRFEGVSLEGEDGVFKGELESKRTRFLFDNILHLYNVALKGEGVLEIAARIVDLQGVRADYAGGVSVEGEDIDLKDIKIKTAEGVEIIATGSLKTDAESRIKGKTVLMKGKTGTVNPTGIEADLLTLGFEDWEGGLTAVLKFAEQLDRCTHVRLEATKESLNVKEEMKWRSNLTLALARAVIEAPIRSDGNIGIETEEGIKLLSTIAGDSINLLAKKSDILMERALLKAKKNVMVEAGGSIIGKTSGIDVGGDIALRAGKDIEWESSKKKVEETKTVVKLGVRRGKNKGKLPLTTEVVKTGNFEEELEQAFMRAGGSITAVAGGNMTLTSVDIASGASTHFAVAGKVTDRAHVLDSHYQRGSTRDDRTQHAVSSYKPGGDFVVEAGSIEMAVSLKPAEGGSGKAPEAVRGTEDLRSGSEVVGSDGPRRTLIDAKGIVKLSGAGGVVIRDVQDDHKHHEEYEKSCGFLGMSTRREKIDSVSSTSVGMTIRGGKGFEIISDKGDITLQNIDVKAPRTILKALDGKVQLLLGRNSYSHSKEGGVSDLFWQWGHSEGRSDSTFTASKWGSTVEIHSKETEVEKVKGKTLEFVDLLEQHGGRIIPILVKEMYDLKEEDHDGPTAALCIVVAIAVTFLTAGVGTAAGGALAGGLGMTTGAVAAGGTATLTTTGAVVAAMTAAGCTSVFSQAAMALLSHKGDLLKAAESLGKSEVLKSLLLSIGTAGLSKWGTEALKVAPLAESATFFDKLGHHAIGEGVRASASIVSDTISGKRFEEALEGGIRCAIAGALGSTFASEIGDLYGNSNINPFEHKFLHAAVGAGTGAILDPEKGALAGAMGAFVAETFSDFMAPEKPSPFGEKINQLKKEKGRNLTEGEFVEAYRQEVIDYNGRVESVAGWSKIVGATAALITGTDVNIAHTTGSVAIDNNFLPHAYGLLVAVGFAWETYEIITTYNDELKRLNKLDKTRPAENIKEAGMAALKKLSVDIAVGVGIGIATGVAGKVAGKFIERAAKSPGSKLIRDKLIESLNRPGFRRVLGETRYAWLIDIVGKISPEKLVDLNIRILGVVKDYQEGGVKGVAKGIATGEAISFGAAKVAKFGKKLLGKGKQELAASKPPVGSLGEFEFPPMDITVPKSAPSASPHAAVPPAAAKSAGNKVSGPWKVVPGTKPGFVSATGGGTHPVASPSVDFSQPAAAKLTGDKAGGSWKVVPGTTPVSAVAAPVSGTLHTGEGTATNSNKQTSQKNKKNRRSKK